VTGLDRLLAPASIAVLGATARPGALSGRFLSGLARHGYDGRVVPVNPKRPVVEGVQAAASIAEAAADGPIDVAVISLPRDAVLGALEECEAAGVAGAVVFTSGFSETGPEGAERERALAAVAARGRMRLLGPNSPGFINLADRTCVIASGVGFVPSLVSGGIAVISQSGGVAGLLVERAQDAGVGLSVAVCSGNEADVTAGELAHWLAEHEPTRVVAMFLEGLRDVPALVAGLGALRDAGKPVVVLKGGATAAAARATAAHTGALATDDVVADAFLARHGAVRVDGFDQLIDTAVALERMGPASGRRVGILSTSGGAGVVATEAAERAGLSLPPLGPEAEARMRAAVPDFAAVGNPADMSGMFSQDPAIFHESVRAFTGAAEFDAAVLVLTVHPPEPSERLADLVLEARAERLAVLWTAGAMSAPARRRLAVGGIAVFEDAERCMRALSARSAFVERDGAALEAAAVELPAERPATEAEALELLGACGVPVPRTEVCADAAAAAAAAATIGGAVVVKASARDLPHKAAAGAVAVGIRSPDEARAAHDRVVAAAAAAGAHPDGSIVQAMAPAGIELIVGARRDPQLGTVLIVGEGGAGAERTSAVARRLLPLREREAAAMLEELGIAPGDAAVAAIEGIARFADGAGERLEAVEVNPLLLHEGDGAATAVDALLLVAGHWR
jgi:acyl-CoA synthetase (NDP forming)